MKVIKKILNKLSGLHYPQEYLCFAKESFQQPLYAYIAGDGMLTDITDLHCFVGYNPLLFAFPSSVFLNQAEPETIHIIFTPSSIKQNVPFNERDVIATLSLRKIYPPQITENIVLFYEGLEGTHHFLSGFHQYVIRLSNNIYGKRPGNIFLKGNLYNQVQIAYSIPRKICLITVGENNLFNLFPTDLHGQIDDQYYVISLRHEGYACSQVESAGRIVLSDMDAIACKEVYSLGKNHMQPLKDRSSFNFSATFSKNFRLPLPNHFAGYKELKLEDSFIYGIHKILLFNIVNREDGNKDTNTLVHIHNSYATWRYKRGLPGNYLLR